MLGDNYKTHTCTHVHSRGGKKVRRFEPSFVCCALEGKFLSSKLYCHARFTVCTCTLLESYHMINNMEMFQES